MFKQISLGFFTLSLMASTAFAQKQGTKKLVAKTQNKTSSAKPSKKIAKMEKPTAQKQTEPINLIDTSKNLSIITSSKFDDNIKEAEIEKPANEAKKFKSDDALKNSRIIKKAPEEERDPSLIFANGLKISKNKFGDDYADYIHSYVTNYHNNFGGRMSRIKTSNRKYFSLIENIMRKNGIPKEFKALCVIESGLNPNAVSPVGAVGPWQFMEGTAKNMGLRVDEELDERRDFYKSTIAAAKFCKRLNGIFNDWLLVVASYNCGPAPVIRALNNTGGKSYWDIKKYLPKETQNHVMAFIATSAFYDKNTKILDITKLPTIAKTSKGKNYSHSNIASNTSKKEKAQPVVAKNKPLEDEQEELPLPAPDPNDPQMTEAELKSVLGIKIKGGYNIEAIADAIDFDVNKLRRWNPNFNEKALSSTESFKLILPNDKVETFIIAKEDILKKSLKNPKPNSTAAPKIANAVNLRARAVEREREKQKAELAAKKSNPNLASTTNKNEKQNTENTKAVTTAKNETTKTAKTVKYVVKQGDNLTEIAEQFGMTVDRLMNINHLTTKNIKVGHTLYLE